MRWLVCLCLSSVAHAGELRVVDASADVVYVNVGSADGLRAGQHVVIGGADGVVVETNAHGAAVRATAAVGATGTFEIVAKRPPRDPEASREQWPVAEPPAKRQHVTPIRPPARAEIELIGTAYATKGDSSAAARAIASFDGFTELPLGLDVDAGARWYSQGANAHERTPLLVRALQLRYGSADDPTLAIGRLRYAATGLGMLDGGRAAYRSGGLEVAAFGGLLPDPVSGKPTSDASRFGAELIYAGEQGRVSATASGSTWLGELDERRLALAGSARVGRTHLDGWLDVQQFPSGNPWGASAIEVTGAGVSAMRQLDSQAYLGVDATFLRPEQSLRLQAALPLEWLTNGDRQVTGSFVSGFHAGAWSGDAVVSIGDGETTGRSFAAFSRFQRGFGAWRAIGDLQVAYTRDLAVVIGDLGLGYAPTRMLDLSLTYRPQSVGGTATDRRWEHQAAADARVTLRHVALAITALGSADALAMLATIVYRPR